MNILFDLMSSTKLQDAFKMFKDVSPYLSRGIRWINSNNIAQYADVIGRVSSLTGAQQEEIIGTLFDRLTDNEQLVGKVTAVALQANKVWEQLSPMFKDVKFKEIWAQIAPLLETSKMNEIVAKVTPVLENAKPVLSQMSSIALKELDRVSAAQPEAPAVAPTAVPTVNANTTAASAPTETPPSAAQNGTAEKSQTTKTEAPKTEQNAQTAAPTIQMPSLFSALGDLGSLLSASFSQVQNTTQAAPAANTTAATTSTIVSGAGSFLDEMIAQLSAPTPTSLNNNKTTKA